MKYFFLFFAAVLSVSAMPALSQPNGPQPNIIYIMTDDLGYGDLGCYGQKPKTPHIDRMCGEGLKFTDHYSGHTVCRPSRLVFLTGQHTGHTAIAGNAAYVLRSEHDTVAELVQRAGYRTGCVGKWALGDAGSSGHPNRQGFDFFYGYLDQGRAHNFYPEHLYRNETREVLPGNTLSKHKNVSEKKVTWAQARIAEEGLAFIRRNQDKPFFLNLTWNIPHTNNEAGRVEGNGQEVPDFGPFKDKDWPDPEKGFAEMIRRMDEGVGDILGLLKELKLAERTLVIFTSDNGPHQEGGHKMEFFDSNGPLRGYKRDLYEGGIRVPHIAWWPGTVKPGVTGHISGFEDFLATACELTGAKAPKTDGLSYLPVLLGKPQSKRPYHVMYAARGDKIQKASVRMENWKAVRLGNKLELYDLSTDIGEAKDLAAEHPDRVATMQAILDAEWMPVD